MVKNERLIYFDSHVVAEVVRMAEVAGEVVRLEALVERAERAKRATQNLLNTMNEIEDAILNIVWKYFKNLTNDELSVFDCGAVKIRWKGSDRFGKSLYLMHRDGGVLPSEIEKLGSFFYYGGDFNAYIPYVTRAKLLDMARDIKGFVRHFAKKLEEMANEDERLTKFAEAVLQALQQVEQQTQS